jgi:hypothetical protein
VFFVIRYLPATRTIVQGFQAKEVELKYRVNASTLANAPESFNTGSGFFSFHAALCV